MTPATASPLKTDLQPQTGTGPGCRSPRVVVITGASAGVGRATAQAFARQGARIALIARGQEGLEATRAEVEALGGEAFVLPLDVAEAEDVENAATLVEERWGPIDVWINSAMVSVFSPVAQMTAEEFGRVTAVTYLGTVHGTLAALRRMQPRDRGIIIQVGCSLAYRSIPLQAAYCAAKQAARGFTDSLRSELIHDGSRVRLTMVHLPAINTPQFDWTKSRLPRKAQPVAPLFQPEVAADAILWSSVHDRRELYVGWPSVRAMIGDKIAPEAHDHYLARTAYDGQQTASPGDPAAALDAGDSLCPPTSSMSHPLFSLLNILALRQPVVRAEAMKRYGHLILTALSALQQCARSRQAAGRAVRQCIRT
jgi:NAD(P)-dependent dehydrogenase (short-subunit alcohol dehydrogenase family)